MSMNMLPMQFDHKVPNQPSAMSARLQEVLARVSTSRRARYGLSVVLCLLFVIAVYAVTGGQYFYHDGSPVWPPSGNETVAPEVAIKPPDWVFRAEKVKDAFIRAYVAYEKHAFPHDELLPISNGHFDE